MIIKYIKETDNTKADALSRKPEYESDKTYKEVAFLYTLENRNLILNIREIAIVNITNNNWFDRLIKAQKKGKTV